MDPTDSRLVVVAFGLVALAGVIAAASLVAPVGAATPSPVTDDTVVERGYTAAATRAAEERGTRLPRAQVFYSQYEYVLEYTGVSQALAGLDAPGRERRFGYPLAIYVSDYADTGVTCRDGGLQTETEPEWLPAGDATYVVDSDATLPTGGSLVVPFDDRASARAFADDCGGDAIDWTTLREREYTVARAAGVEAAVPERRGRADRRVAAVRDSLDRPVSVVVGRDAPTLSAAVDAAPPNTTVLLPPGRYRGGVNVTKPLTIRARGAGGDGPATPTAGSVVGDAPSAAVTVDGGGNGSVIRVTASNVTVAGLRLVGVGEATVPSRQAVGSANGSWDARVVTAYGSGDAGVWADDAPGLYVRNVTIETGAGGVLARESDAVVDAVRVQGDDGWQEGFMGVAALRSTVVVQQSVFRDGRDGIYLHRADGSVLRDNRFVRGRFGVHLMYTSDALVADNVARSQDLAGVVVMTSPSGNAIVGNDVRRSRAGVLTAGSQSYVARNVVVGTDDGLSTAATQSVYEHNVLVDNEAGLSASSVVPSSTVAANDFLGNERHAEVSASLLRVFGRDGRGNYWAGATGRELPDGTLSRPYAPTAALDRLLARTDAATTLRASPVVDAVRGLRGSAPGLRSAGAVDRSPLAEPANPELLAAARDGTAVGGPDWLPANRTTSARATNATDTTGATNATDTTNTTTTHRETP